MSSRCTNPTTGEQLAAYELGQLPEADRSAFEAHLHECQHCTEELWATAPWMAPATSAPRHVLNWLDRMRPDRQGAPSASLRDRWTAWWSRQSRVLIPAAALAGLTLMMLYEFSPPGTASLAQLEPVPWVPVDIRAGVDEDGARFRAAMQEYANGRYSEASEQLSQVVSSEGLTTIEGEQATLFLGISRLLYRDVAGAVEFLEAAREATTPIVADQGTWYLAQTHLVRNEPDRARPLLEELAGQLPGRAASPAYGDRAAEQLRDLRDRQQAR